MAKPQVGIVLRCNHFDPIWRRCWDRDFYDSGRRFVSYRKIEEEWISDSIATTRDGKSCFVVECSWVLRHYLERHPEHLKTLQRLIREGRFELLGSGENIIDANMVHGEMLARNLILGTLWAEQTLGSRPVTGCHADGFGSSAQMPQIFRECGYDWIPSLAYNVPDAPFWRGLDGSVILYEVKGRLSFCSATAFNMWRKLSPCPACNGRGCGKCGKKGFVTGDRAEFNAPPLKHLPGDVAIFVLGGEEIQPGLRVARDIAEFNARTKDFRIRQGIYRDLREYIADELAQVDNPPENQVSSKVENNPSQTGCYVTRIRCKQEHRKAEHLLLAAECWDAILNNGRGFTKLRDAWKKMSFSAFHDAITSSHCDPAHAELRDLHAEIQSIAKDACATACKRILRRAGNTITVFNHHGNTATALVKIRVAGKWQGAEATLNRRRVPVYEVNQGKGVTDITFLAREIPGLGAATVKLSKAPARSKKLSSKIISMCRYTVKIGEHGITGISVKGAGQVINTRKFLLGELVLEHDLGDPWSTRSLDRSREHLSPYTHLSGVERMGDSIVIRYTGRHPSTDNIHTCDVPEVTYLTWQQNYYLRAGLPWLEVETKVDWYTQSRRLRLAFPSTAGTNKGVYDIPYGVLARDRYEAKSIRGGNAGGDWPAIHWAGIQLPKYTFAVFNQGTPSYRVENGAVLVSVLRSPVIPYCLLEPASYVAYNFAGMVDPGTHVFRHAVYIGKGSWHENDTVVQASVFNSGFSAYPGTSARPLPVWRLTSKHTQLTAVKSAEDRHGIILRLVEHSGRKETVILHIPPEFRHAWLCNLLEENLQPLNVKGGNMFIEMKPWKIKTIRLSQD